MKYVIFAPHVDDEMIGCYRLLQEGSVTTVYYFFDLTEERKQEAIYVGKFYNFTPVFVENFLDVIVDPTAIILAPNIADNHVHHKNINRFAKKFANQKKYYSIDMNVKFDVLTEFEQLRKRVQLFRSYPSQQKLLEDDKYHLFESLVDDDSKKVIWVTFQKKGLHRFPRASEEENLQDVKYLGNVHRHLFKFKVSIEVNHADREIEFHQFLNWLESLYESNLLNLDFKSCEMISDDLANYISREYNDRKLVIEVSEDGECGCTCEYFI